MVMSKSVLLTLIFLLCGAKLVLSQSEEGRWVKSVEQDKQMWIEFKDGIYSLVLKGKYLTPLDNKDDLIHYRIDKSTQPATVDIFVELEPNLQIVYKGIIKFLSNNEILLNVNETVNGSRPRDFDSKNHLYKRVKSAH